MTIDTGTTWLEDALKYVSQEARHHVADALYCQLHNTGQTLAGNTQENDLEWFSRIMFEAEETRDGHRWDNARPDVQGTFRMAARMAIKAMPKLQDRMAHRLIELSKVMEDIARAERLAEHAIKRKGK